MKRVLPEVASWGAALGASWWLVQRAAAGALTQAGLLAAGPPVRTAEEFQALVSGARWQLLIGAGALLLGRIISALRGRDRGTIPTPLLLPPMVCAMALGLALQVGYGHALASSVTSLQSFGHGCMLAGIVGGLVLAIPFDPARTVALLQWPLAASIPLTFAALALFGTGPTGSGTRINLGPIQPLELVKVALVAVLAHYLGQRAAKLRYQRDRAGVLAWPRPTLLLPALGLLLVLFSGLLFVRDLGPILILSLLFLGMFYVVTRSLGWVALALGLTGGLVGLVAARPSLVARSVTLTTRLKMWLNPWLNGVPGGDQAVAGFWALAAGGWTGQGLGFGHPGAIPAGHTDLILAQLGEELGLVGLVAYFALLSAVILSGLLVAARNRTPERSLMAGGLSLLLLFQWAVIFYGTTGLIPLTGVVVPFLSSGRSSMVVFVALVALVARLAEGGRRRAWTDELAQLSGGWARLGAVGLVLLVGALGVSFWLSVVVGPRSSARGVVTTLGDGTVVLAYDRRLTAIARRVRRGEFLDREGAVLVGNDEQGRRSYPLGSALGTLIGPLDRDILRPAWSLERQHEHRLRGYPDLPDGPAVWLTPDGNGGERLLFAVNQREERPADRARAEEQANGSTRLLALPAPDLRPLVDLLRLGPTAREERITQLNADIATRSVQLSLHAGLQQATAAALANWSERGLGAAAAAVIDVDTGQVLARAQVPDYDPGDRDAWRAPLVAQDPGFIGTYGPWVDKTGPRGVYQLGSVSKLLTAMAAMRAGEGWSGSGCSADSATPFGCVLRDREGPYFTRPGWTRRLHDFWRDEMHGQVRMRQGLAVSCNVYFGQLGLHLGPEPFRDLVAAGLEFGWHGDRIEPGEPETRHLASTAFGQGVAAMNVMQAARMTAAVGAGGVYRRCPSDMQQNAACEERTLLPESASAAPILAGMREVMTTGTGRFLRGPDGVRLYGKSGTADAIGLAEEAAWGVEAGSTNAGTHAWFVALAESEAITECDLLAPGRLAVAVVVPRGGSGGGVAGRATMEIITAAAELGLVGPQ